MSRRKSIELKEKKWLWNAIKTGLNAIHHECTKALGELQSFTTKSNEKTHIGDENQIELA